MYSWFWLKKEIAQILQNMFISSLCLQKLITQLFLHT